MDGDQLLSLIRHLRSALTDAGCRISPVNLIVDAGRVRAGYRIGETLFGGRNGRYTLLHIIGERPGTGHHTLSIYMTVADGKKWGTPDTVDHNITKVVSGIAMTTLTPDLGSIESAKILREMLATEK
jgi:ethanolamine ammonia-lyase large subunit